eukprot:scpid92705/ scgid9218/ 
MATSIEYSYSSALSETTACAAMNALLTCNSNGFMSEDLAFRKEPVWHNTLSKKVFIVRSSETRIDTENTLISNYAANSYGKRAIAIVIDDDVPSCCGLASGYVTQDRKFSGLRRANFDIYTVTERYKTTCYQRMKAARSVGQFTCC